MIIFTIFTNLCVKIIVSKWYDHLTVSLAHRYCQNAATWMIVSIYLLLLIIFNLEAFKRKVIFMLHAINRRLEKLEARQIAEDNLRHSPVSVPIPIDTMEQFHVLSSEVSNPEIASRMVFFQP